MTSTTVREYNEAAANVPEDALLGSLTWYTISDVDIPWEKAKQGLIDQGLSTDLLKPIRPVDAFRNASMELKRSFKAANNVKINFMVRSKGQDNDCAYREVVAERVTTKAGQKRRLTYDASADLIYHRGTRAKDGTVTGDYIEITRFSPSALERDMSPEQKEWLSDHLDQLPERFRHLRTHLGNHKVRNFVREYIQSLGAISVRDSGGVYFVKQANTLDLERIGEWIQTIGSSFHSTPLLDLVNQREMLARAFEEEAISKVEILSKEIDQILEEGGRKVKESTFDDYAMQAAELTSKARDYAEMLDIRSEIAHMRIDQFKKKAMALVERIDYGKA